MRVGLIQTCAGDDPTENLPKTASLVDQAVADGATFVLTPEVTNCVSTSRTRQQEVLSTQDKDITLAHLRALAAGHNIWVLIGSLALKTADADGRFANRSFLITPQGDIAATYDKIHMFDVEVSSTETYRESAGYRPGEHLATAQMDGAILGLTVCYDLRFPALFQTLAGAGAGLLSVPSAFAVPTGQAHWHSLLRARAIETGSFVLAPAQTGEHPHTRGRPRSTYGHSLVVDPWGQVLLDADTPTGAFCVDLDLERISQAREKIPNLKHTRPIEISAL